MARRKNPNNNIPDRNRLLLIALLLIPELLIAIGDGVRFSLRLFFSPIKAAYNIIRGNTTEVAHASFHWGKEKFQRIKSILAQKLKTPKKSIPISSEPTPVVQFPPVTMPKLPTLRLPRIRIKLPAFPTLRLPTFKLPHLRLPGIPRLPRTFDKTQKPAVAQSRVLFQGSKTEKIKSFTLGIGATILFIFVPYIAYQWLQALPNPQLLSRRDLEVTTKIYDRNGALLYEIYADQNRTPLSLAEIPDYVKQATIAIEDQEFYRHQGISLRGITRALREIAFNKKIQGGSTITQQLVKSALLNPEIKISRKAKEILLAFWAELLYSKNEILEMYLNQVPYGGTAWGVEAASQTYFGKSVREVTLAEAALLAGLPAAPSEYSPFGSHPEKALVRQKEVLKRMVDDRYITREQAQEAEKTQITFAAPRVAIRAPHFVMYIKNLLENRYGARLVERGGLRITTSLDVTLQEKVEDIVRTHVESLRNLRVGNGAAVIANPKTGEILAMVGSKDYFDIKNEGNVNVTTALRQPGSSIKVVNYATALENGFTAASIIDDNPIVYNTPGSQPYAPVNYDGKFHGPTSLRYALGNSYNIPAVKILAKIGVLTMIEKGRLMGITTWDDESRFGLSLTLGGGEVTMLDMAKVFGTLANGGKRMDLLPVLEVTDYTGRVIERNHPKNGVAALKPETAWIMSNILSDNTARIAAFGPNSSLVIPGKTVSVKTGTTDSKRDNWTIGFTPSYVTAVWVGNNNNAPMDPYLTSGVTGAAPIWRDIMTEILKNAPDEVAIRPENVVAIPCYFGRTEYFIRGTEPAFGRCAPMPTTSPAPTPTPKP